MAINWQLKIFLAKKHGIFRPTDIQKSIVKSTNVLVSLSNISKLMNKRPASIRLTTVELICTAFDCSLSDILDIKPLSKKRHESVKKLSYKNTPNKGEMKFPDPKDYQ